MSNAIRLATVQSSVRRRDSKVGSAALSPNISLLPLLLDSPVSPRGDDLYKSSMHKSDMKVRVSYASIVADRVSSQEHMAFFHILTTRKRKSRESHLLKAFGMNLPLSIETSFYFYESEVQGMVSDDFCLLRNAFLIRLERLTLKSP